MLASWWRSSRIGASHKMPNDAGWMATPIGGHSLVVCCRQSHMGIDCQCNSPSSASTGTLAMPGFRLTRRTISTTWTVFLPFRCSSINVRHVASQSLFDTVAKKHETIVSCSFVCMKKKCRSPSVSIFRQRMVFLTEFTDSGDNVKFSIVNRSFNITI